MTETNKMAARQVMNALSDRNLDGVVAGTAPGCRFYGWSPEPLDADILGMMQQPGVVPV